MNPEKRGLSETEWVVIAVIAAALLAPVFFGLLPAVVPGEVLAAFFVVSLLLCALGGLVWLIFRRCRFSVAQIVVTSLAYGLAMTIGKLAPYRDYGQTEWLIVFAGTNALALAVGLFIGSRNVQAVSEQSRAGRWVVFIAGLLTVYAVFGVPSAFLIMLIHKSRISNGAGFALLGVFVSSIVCLALTAGCHWPNRRQ